MPDTFPTPAHSGPQFLKYRKRPKDWTSATLKSVFEDQGRDFNVSAADVPQFWEFEYDGLTEVQAKVLVDFWNAHLLNIGFTFIEPREFPIDGTEGATFTDVRFESPIEMDHTRASIVSVKLVLVKYP